MGNVESIGGDGRSVQLDPNRQLPLDYGKAVTSHSSQGQTADRVLIHVDTEVGAKDLLNRRMAYVAVSRGAHDAKVFRDDAAALGRELTRDVSHMPAVQQATAPQAIEQRPARTHEMGEEIGTGT